MFDSNAARLIPVIETNLTTRGTGVYPDPYRGVRQYWTPDGELLAEVDAWMQERNAALPDLLYAAEMAAEQLEIIHAEIAGLTSDDTIWIQQKARLSLLRKAIAKAKGTEPEE